MPDRSPANDAVRALLNADLLEWWDAEGREFDNAIGAAGAAHARAQESFYSACHGRPLEHRTAELEQEHAALIADLRQRYGQSLQVILADWARRFVECEIVAVHAAARRVIASWASGDLAAAVRELARALPTDVKTPTAT